MSVRDIAEVIALKADPKRVQHGKEVKQKQNDKARQQEAISLGGSKPASLGAVSASLHPASPPQARGRDGPRESTEPSRLALHTSMKIHPTVRQDASPW